MNSKLNGTEWPFDKFEKEFSLVKIFTDSDTIRVKTGLFKNQRYNVQPLANFGEWKCGYIKTEFHRQRIVQTYDGEIKYREVVNLPFYINFNEQLAWISERYLDLVSEALQLKAISKFNFRINSVIFNYEQGLTKGLTVRNINFVRTERNTTARMSYSGFINLKELLPEFKSEYDLDRSDTNIKNITLSIELEKIIVPFSIQKEYLSIRAKLSPKNMLDFFESIFPLIPKSRQQSLHEFLE